MTERANVFLALPSYGQDAPEAKMALRFATQEHSLVCALGVSSLLGFTFNELWAKALNLRAAHGLTHFAMIHSDIFPQTWWLDALIAEQRRVQADVLSVVIPLKDEKQETRGGTSTALCNPDYETGHKRLTMDDIYDYTPTFSAPEGKVLLPNTGLWVCDFTKPWVESIHFHIHDTIQRTPDGKFVAYNFPEDWNFGIDCAKLGVKVFCTRTIEARHCGRKWYTNQLESIADAARRVA